MNLEDAVASGDRRLALTALRDRLARAIGDAEEKSIAALAKQLADVLRELDAMPVGNEESKVDELAQRRLARRADPDVPVGSGEGVVGGS